jgi:PKHD-type hydroxylase
MPYAIEPAEGLVAQDYEYWRGGFKETELNRIMEQCDTLPLVEAHTGSGETQGDELHLTRNSHIAWVPFTPEFEWLYTKLAFITREINKVKFRFDIWGFHEQLQYTVYNAEVGPQHYNWHIDNMGANKVPRKLSFTLQLSDAMTYEGGELWIQGRDEICVVKTRGLVHYFPSYVRHRVTPITSGTRKALVGWISGPEFR